MAWLWVVVAGVVLLVALVALASLVLLVRPQARDGLAAVRHAEYLAEAAMTHAMQNAVSEMFDAVRRTR